MKTEIYSLPKIQFKPYETESDEQYFEIVGVSSPLTDKVKAEIVSHLCQAQPHLMSRWRAELKNRLVLGRNYVAITEDKKLIIREKDIPVVVFSFDPNKKAALSELMTKMSIELRLSDGLILDLDNARLRIHGGKLDRSDCVKIARFVTGLNREIYVAHENYGLAELGLKESVVMPLSAIQLLLDYFKLDYKFPYLGSLNNSQINQFLGKGTIEDHFLVKVGTASDRLGSNLYTMLKSTDGQTCRENLSSSLIPRSKL